MRAAMFAVAVLWAVAVACGGDKSPSGTTTEALCASACDKINSCQTQLQTTACVAGTYVPACKSAIDGGDDARKTEATCLKTSACADAPKCLGNVDPCAGVTCDADKICNPGTKACAKPNCQWRIQGQDCLGDQVCIGPKGSGGKVTNGFCSPVLPRTYVFHFGKVDMPATNNGMTWRMDGTLPDLKVGVELNGVVSHVSAAAKGTLFNDFTNDPTATFSLAIPSGDEIKVGVFDGSPDGDRLLTSCAAGTDTAFADFVRGNGLNCQDANQKGFFLEIHPQ